MEYGIGPSIPWGKITTIDWDPRLKGSGRPSFGRWVKARRRGRPSAPLDQIVGHVLHCQSVEPGRKVESIVAEVCDFHRVKRAVVWKALKQHRPDEPIVFDTVLGKVWSVPTRQP